MRGAPRGGARAVAMPLCPEVGESFPGYLWRLADWNIIDNPRDLLFAADCRTENGRNFSELSEIRLRRIAEVARLEFKAVQGLFSGTYNQGVPTQWLRHKQPSVGRAVLGDEQHHRALWMLSPIGFCSESWSNLLNRCPACAAPFDWNVVVSHACAKCERQLSGEDFSSVPEAQRPMLRTAVDWLKAPFSPVEQADIYGCRRLEGLAKSELFQLVVIVGRALAKQTQSVDLRTGPGVTGSLELFSGFEAVKRLDDFLVEISPKRKNKTMPPFLRQLALSERLTTGALGLLLRDILVQCEQGVPGVKRLKAAREHAGGMTARQLAQKLRVERSTLKNIVDRRKVEILVERGESRRHVWFTQKNYDQAREYLDSRISARTWRIRYHIRTIEMEQFIELGLLAKIPSRQALNPSIFELERMVADRLVERVLAEVLVGKRDPQWVSLEWLFTCLGAAYKPWGALLQAIVQGKLREKVLSRSQYFGLRGLYVQRDLACEFRDRLLEGKPPLFSPFLPASSDWCPLIARGDAEDILNISSREVTWLARHGYFGSEAEKGGLLPRDRVEAVGQNYVGTREVAALAGLMTMSVRSSFQKLGVSPVMPDVPFWRRQEVMGDAGAIHEIAHSSETWTAWASRQR